MCLELFAAQELSACGLRYAGNVISFRMGRKRSPLWLAFAYHRPGLAEVSEPASERVRAMRAEEFGQRTGDAKTGGDRRGTKAQHAEQQNSSQAAGVHAVAASCAGLSGGGLGVEALGACAEEGGGGMGGGPRHT